MGCKHSTLPPEEDDWLYEHGPPSVPLSSTLGPKPKGDTYEFVMKKNCWKKETPVDDLVLKFLPLENKCCILMQGDDPLLVMKIEAAKTIQLCSLKPAKPSQASCGTYQEQPLYKWAVVSKRKESHQYDMVTTADGANYGSEYYGSVVFGKRKLMLKREGLPCASMDRSGNDRYKCRIGPGIDPVLIVSFVACMDKIHETEMKTLEARSYVSPYRPAIVFY